MALYREEQYVPVDVVIALDFDLGKRQVDINPVRRYIHSNFLQRVISGSYRGDVRKVCPDPHRALTIFHFEFRDYQWLDRWQI